MSARATRREVLAFVALADAPTPEQIDFNTYGNGTTFGLTFTRISEARSWLGVFGDGVLQEPVERVHNAKENKPAWRSFIAYDAGDWRGWRIRLDAREDVDAPDGQLDDATRGKLAAVAAATATYEREDLVTNGPLPAGIEGRSLGGRRDGGAL